MASLPKPIFISPEAEKNLDEIYAYLLHKFGKSTLLKFNKKWLEFLSLISYHPTIFPFLSKRKNLRKHTLYKRNLVVYKNGRNNIEIVAIFNTWQNPLKLNKL